MNKTLLFISLILLLSISGFSQNYKQVKVYLNNADELHVLASTGVDIEHSRLDKDMSISFFVSDEEFSIIQSLGFRYEIIIDDWFEYYNSLPIMTESEMQAAIQLSQTDYGVSGFGYGSMGGFYTYAEAIAQLDSMYAQFPNLITQKFPIGTSHEGRTIWAAKISDNPNVAENEPQAGYDALIHAREPQSMATLIYFMYYLLENYGTDPEVTYLVNNREIFCVPVYNPDGYERNRQTNPNGGGMWRKNRRNNGDGSFGVDLNRNYSYKWGYDNSGSSPTPSSETYRGPAPFSEPEAQAVRDLIESLNIKTHFNMHSWQDAYLYPWGYINAQTPDSAAYFEFAYDMTRFNNYAFGTGSQVLGYNSNGSARDWLYGEQVSKNKIFGYTVEIGNSSDYFWPPQSRIIPLAQINVKPNLYHAWVAGEYVVFNSASLNPMYFNPGTSMEMTATLKNKGLATGNGITAQITSLSPYVTITNGTAYMDSLPARITALLNDAFTFTVDASAPIESEIKLLFTTSMQGLVISKDTLLYVVGVPEYLFVDTLNNPLVNWTVTGTPSNSPKWEATTTTFYSAPASYTDSRLGNYINNATVTMTLTNPLNLTTYNNPQLSFWTKFDIEDNWDYGQVRVSTNNGTSWIPLAGKYTQPGVNSFQPNGQPVYDGLMPHWVREEISLANYATNQVKFQFQLRTDGSTVRDGWYLDDIGVIVYNVIPVEMQSLTAFTSGNEIMVSWTTAAELNNSGFNVEKRNDKSSGWQNLAFINGKGTTSEKTNYSYRDKNPINGTNIYRLKQFDFDGSTRIYGPVEVDYQVTREYSLSQNYPNPFNPSTVINYSIAREGHVEIKIFNILGSEVATLVDEFKEASRHTIELNIDDMNIGSGVYFYSIKSGSFTQTRKMIVMK